MSYAKLLDVASTMRNNSLSNYIVPGLVSSLIGDGGTPYGKVRMFHASREATDFITPHSHRFELAILVLTGEVDNTLFHPATYYPEARDDDKWMPSTITQVCGADGILEYRHEYPGPAGAYARRSRSYGPGDVIHMKAEDIHSIVYHKGASAILFEGPEQTKTSTMLEPFVNGKLVPTFKTQDWMFEKIK
jgi:hypothetical protein